MGRNTYLLNRERIGENEGIIERKESMSYKCRTDYVCRNVTIPKSHPSKFLSIPSSLFSPYILLYSPHIPPY
jgi:hypothetical protein